MAPNNFVFPPPPPPPPQTSYQSYPTHLANQSRNNPANHHPQYGAYRGRGQANGFRGSTLPRGNISQRQNFGFHGSQHQSMRGTYASQISLPVTPHQTQKQIRQDAFGESFRRDRSTAPRAPAAPAVPRFGLPLPSKPVAAPEVSVPVKKRKREHNQLGLTPKQEEHVSSEEDVDEEERLARSMGITSNGQLGLRITYNGRSSTLSSSSELAAWLAERKKRYPTRARIEGEKARKSQQQEEARLARIAKQEQERKEKEEQKIQLERLKVKERIQRKKEQKQENPCKGNELSREEKAVQKAEKLRRKYERAQEKVARLTAPISRSKAKVESSPELAARALRKARVDDLTVAGHAAAGGDAEALLTPTSRSHSPIQAAEADISDISRTHDALLSPAKVQDHPVVTLPETLAFSDSSSLDFSDSTSSDSDSDSTSRDSSNDDDESSDSNSAPIVLSSKVPSSEPASPPKPPPPKQVKNEICRSYLRNGRCPFEGRCQYKHELPERGARQKEERKQQDKRQKQVNTRPVAPRLTLYQRMVLQEKEEEDEAILNHIIYLGEKGLLERERKG